MTCRVWSKFQATKSDGSLVKLRIQDLPENRFEDVVELYMKYFINEEAFKKAAGIPQSQQALTESRVLVTKKMMSQSSLNVICCEDDSGEVGKIVGMSLMSLVVAGSIPGEEMKAETKEVQILYKLLKAVSDLYDPLEELKVPCYYDDRGMVVHPQFRHLGIATELFKARHQACIAHDVPATIAFMTSCAAQRVAEKNNWTTVREVSLDKLGHQCGVTFQDPGVRKLMMWKHPQLIALYEKAVPSRPILHTHRKRVISCIDAINYV